MSVQAYERHWSCGKALADLQKVLQSMLRPAANRRMLDQSAFPGNHGVAFKGVFHGYVTSPNREQHKYHIAVSQTLKLRVGRCLSSFNDDN